MNAEKPALGSALRQSWLHEEQNGDTDRCHHDQRSNDQNYLVPCHFVGLSRLSARRMPEGSH